MPKLGVNIDHIATLRQARRGFEPNPLEAVSLCEDAGADSLVAHLREDRRHMQDNDIKDIRRIARVPFNLEMSLNPRIVQVALTVRPDLATLVPERRQEITTEGGLDVLKHFRRIGETIETLHRKKIRVSLFIDPERTQIEKSKQAGTEVIELHTGRYAHTQGSQQKRELKKLARMTAFAKSLGLTVSAGHGLNYQNALAVAKIEGIEELNIGHAIVARAVFIGLSQAVHDMKNLIKG